MSVPQRASLITLGVADVERATAFYEAMGWRSSSSSVPGEVTFFQLGSLALALWSYRELLADAGVDASHEQPRHAGVAVAMNLHSPDEVVAALAAAQDAGATVKPGATTEWGGFSGYFSDPDGHLWEVAHNPFWELGQDGSVRLPG